MIDPENREYITSVECINSLGETIPPMMLISGVYDYVHEMFSFFWVRTRRMDGTGSRNVV